MAYSRRKSGGPERYQRCHMRGRGGTWSCEMGGRRDRRCEMGGKRDWEV